MHRLGRVGFRPINFWRVRNTFDVCQSAKIESGEIGSGDPYPRRRSRPPPHRLGRDHHGDGRRLAWVAHGVIHPDTKADLADRLADLAAQLRIVVDQHQPDAGGGRGDLRGGTSTRNPRCCWARARWLPPWSRSLPPG